MSVTNYWENYYLNTQGKLKRKKKTFVPKYLKRSKSFAFTTQSKKTAVFNDNPTFEGWNKCAHFRYNSSR